MIHVTYSHAYSTLQDVVKIGIRVPIFILKVKEQSTKRGRKHRFLVKTLPKGFLNILTSS
jgi:hypothetical protein